MRSQTYGTISAAVLLTTAILASSLITHDAFAGFGHTKSYGQGTSNTPSGVTTPNTPTPPLDTDGDGIPDALDSHPNDPNNGRDVTAPIFSSLPTRLDITTQTTGNILNVIALDTPASAISYQLDGAGASHFAIQSGTGAVTLSSALSASLSPLAVTVIATDAAGNAVRQNLAIHIMAATPQQALSFASTSGANTQEPQTLQVPTISGGSGQGSVSYNSLTPGICSVNSTGLVSTILAGTCRINAVKSSSGDFLAVTTATPFEFTVTQGPYAYNGQTYSRCVASVAPCNAVSGQVMATKTFVERGECDAVIFRNGGSCLSIMDRCGSGGRIWATFMIVREGSWYWRLSPANSTADKPVSTWRTRNWFSTMSNDRPQQHTGQYPDNTYDSHGTHVNLCMRP